MKEKLVNYNWIPIKLFYLFHDISIIVFVVIILLFFSGHVGGVSSSFLLFLHTSPFLMSCRRWLFFRGRLLFLGIIL